MSPARAGCQPVHALRLVKPCREDGRISGLLRDARGPKPGLQPLDPTVEEIVSRYFKGFMPPVANPPGRGSGA